MWSVWLCRYNFRQERRKKKRQRIASLTSEASGGSFSVSRRKKPPNGGHAGEDEDMNVRDCVGERGALNGLGGGDKKKTASFSLQKARAASHPLLENLVTLSALEKACARARVCEHISAGAMADWMGLAALTCQLWVSMAFIFVLRSSLASPAALTLARKEVLT